MPRRSASGLEQSLRRAVEAGELLLMFQPQVALHTFEVMGLEALLRWRKPDGQIAHRRRIHSHCRKDRPHPRVDRLGAASGHRDRRGVARAGVAASCVAINVSPPQFFESDFVEHIGKALEVTALPASALELELTETVLQTGSNTIDSLRRLRELGRVDRTG